MTSADRIREQKICEAVVRVLEKQQSDTRSDGLSPEKPPHRSEYSDRERVDWVVQIGGSKFAIEVTLVQAIPERLAEVDRARKFFEPIMRRLCGKLPDRGTYELCVQHNALSGITGTRLTSISGCLEAWILKEAPGLGTKAPCHFARETPVGIGFEVTLYCFPRARHRGCLRYKPFTPENLEEQQQPLIQHALKNKLPKLKRWHDMGANTVLAIEIRDIVLSNEHLVANLLVAELRSRAVDLDHLFVVDTAFSRWAIYEVVSTEQEGQSRLEEIMSTDESQLTPVH